MSASAPSLSDGSNFKFLELHRAGYRLMLLERYQELACSFLGWTELASSALTPTEIQRLGAKAGTRIGILSGFVSGRVFLFAETEEVKRWITLKLNLNAVWMPYICERAEGYLTSFRHSGRRIAEEVFGGRAAEGAAKASDLLGSVTASPEDKPNIIAAALAQPGLFSPIESGWRVIDSFGAVYVFGESDFVPLRGDFDPRTVESGVAYRSDWLAYPHSGGWIKKS